ncbi:hypothetical protein ACIPY5_03625 [Microbacterium sp. NPDC089698]|uniref:hypothetical protein n=1 Tax=Microbacterium sp. NPDC089698 TaxID=3364200 RepID=UPI00382D0B3E
MVNAQALGQRVLAAQGINSAPVSLHELSGAGLQREKSHTVAIQMPGQPLEAVRSRPLLTALIDQRRDDDHVVGVETP